MIFLQKVKNSAIRLWYAKAAVENGWSRDVLALQIDSGLHGRQGKAVTNFARTLPPPHSDLAQQSLKDPYIFDFLTLTVEAQERDVHRPIGVAAWRTRLTRALPKSLRPNLPAVDIIEPKAFIVLKEGAGPSPELEEDIKKWVLDRLAPYKCPRWVEFVKELPKGATGKIQRSRLR